MANIPGGYYGYSIYVTRSCKQFRISPRGKITRATIWIGQIPGIF